MSWNGKFTGSMEDRASKPDPNGRTAKDYDKQFAASDAPIPLAVHHITDWKLLRGTWNALFDSGHFSTLCIWLYAVGFDTGSVYYETGAAQTPAMIARAMRAGEDIGLIADADEIHQRVTWSSWNLVEGPKESTRTDDLGNFHDVFSGVRAGLTQAEAADLTLADNVYTAMAGLNLANPIPPERASAISGALLAVNRAAMVIKYRPEMWLDNGSGAVKRWRKNI